MSASPAAESAAPHDPFVGQSAGAYVLTRPLGEGGMGVVYEARHATLAQRAAVKLLRRELASSERDLMRFLNEARTISAVQHPGIVKIFDIGQIDGTPFILMELLDGEPLQARLERSPGRRLALSQVLDLGCQAAAALAVIHSRGFVHRDLKPDNMFLCPDPAARRGERLVLLDFGIAKFLDTQIEGGGATVAGVTLGTPLYMAPEQCEARKDLNSKVDVYALGVLLYEMMSGQYPFDAETPLAIMHQHMIMPAPLLSTVAPDAPGPLVELVASMLAKPPAERPTMDEVAARLQALLLTLSTPDLAASVAAAYSSGISSVGSVPPAPSPVAYAPPSVPPQPAPPPQLSLSRGALWLGTGFTVALLAIGLGALALRGLRKPPAMPRTVAARPVTPPPAAPPAPVAAAPEVDPDKDPAEIKRGADTKKADSKRGADKKSETKRPKSRSRINLARDRLD